MKTPIITLSLLKKCTVVAIVCGLIAMPGVAFSQQDDQESSVNQSSSRANSGPWINSPAANIGTTTIAPSSSLEEEVLPGSVSSQGNAAGAQRTGTGGIRIRTNGTAERGGPGGNPDVPFDPNMNLCFLAVGIVFSVWILRKRLVAKPVSA